MTFESAIRKAYKGRMTPQSPCVTADDLESFYSDRLPANRMDEIRSHLASCETCLELARDYCVFRGIKPPAEPVVSIESGRRRSWISKPMTQIAAALLLAVTVGVVWIATRNATAPQTPAVRGVDRRSEPRLISPKGTLQEAPKQLEWETIDAADFYEVEIQDADFNVIWRQGQIREPRVQIPDGVVSRMRPGTYGWRVAAAMPNGKQLISGFATFEVAR